MLSGERNAEKRWKTTIGLMSRKATLHVQHTFLYISLPLFCTTTTWNFQKLSYTFNGGMSYVFSFTFFTASHFHLAFDLWPLAFLILSAPLKNFHPLLPTKKCLLCFSSLALDLCRPFSRWVSLACHFFSFSLSFSCSVFQICGHDN